jgi:hypothetical protein
MAGDEGKAHWIDPECDALLDGLIAKKSTHQSGNGFKPTVWAEIVKDVHAANPGVRPKKDQTTVFLSSTMYTLLCPLFSHAHHLSFCSCKRVLKSISSFRNTAASDGTPSFTW